MDKEKVLLIEDDLPTRSLYQDILTNAGYEVDQAPDGEAGLDKILKGGYKLILLDIMMPKKDGLSVLEDLKGTDWRHKNGPIVLLSALGQDAFINEGFSLGAEAYLIKSALTPEQVLEEIRNILAKGKTLTDKSLAGQGN